MTRDNDDDADLSALPRRPIGANLPPEARVRAEPAPDGRWAIDEKAMRMLLNGLLRWQRRPW